MAKNSNTEYNALASSSFMAPAIQRKTRGFVDFDLQVFRPDAAGTANAHEKRFEAYNYFPKNISSNRPVPNVHMTKGLERDNRMYAGISMSDPLFNHKMMKVT
jgi:hypothetical protein